MMISNCILKPLLQVLICDFKISDVLLCVHVIHTLKYTYGLLKRLFMSNSGATYIYSMHQIYYQRIEIELMQCEMQLIYILSLNNISSGKALSMK